MSIEIPSMAQDDIKKDGRGMRKIRGGFFLKWRCPGGAAGSRGLLRQGSVGMTRRRNDAEFRMDSQPTHQDDAPASP
jgi:hypothetical protein